MQRLSVSMIARYLPLLLDHALHDYEENSTRTLFSVGYVVQYYIVPPHPSHPSLSPAHIHTIMVLLGARVKSSRGMGGIILQMIKKVKREREETNI